MPSQSVIVKSCLRVSRKVVAEPRSDSCSHKLRLVLRTHQRDTEGKFASLVTQVDKPSGSPSWHTWKFSGSREEKTQNQAKNDKPNGQSLQKHLGFIYFLLSAKVFASFSTEDGWCSGNEPELQESIYGEVSWLRQQPAAMKSNSP